MMIVDASVVFKWFNESEDGYIPARDLLKHHLAQEIEIIVPDLVLYELTNAWATKTQMTADNLIDNLRILAQYLPEPIPVSYQLIERAGILAKHYVVSVYDSVYTVLAEDYGCDLVTADERFVSKVNLPFVKLLAK